MDVPLVCSCKFVIYHLLVGGSTPYIHYLPIGVLVAQDVDPFIRRDHCMDVPLVVVENSLFTIC